MKRNRIIAILVAAVFAFSLVACGGSSASSTQSAAPAATEAPAAAASATSEKAEAAAPAATEAPAAEPAAAEPAAAEPAAEPAAAEPAEEPAAAPADDGQVYNLVWNYFTTEAIGTGQFMIDCKNRIEEKTNGRVTLELYFNGTLLSTQDSIQGCINGIADIITVDNTMVGEVFPLNDVMSMPLKNTPPGKRDIDECYERLLEDCPELQEELAKQGLAWLDIAACGGFHLHGTSAEFPTPDSLAGKTIEGLGCGAGIINQWGGNGVTLDPGDYYLSLSTGLLDGQLAHLAEMWGLAMHELLTTHTFFTNATDTSDYEVLFGGGIYCPMLGALYNIEKFNELPDDLREIVLEECNSEKAREFFFVFNMEEATNVLDEAIERGDTFIFINEDQRGAWTEQLQPVMDDWIARCEAAGYTEEKCMEIYNHMCDLFLEYA